jgi:hypothetical protein
MTSGDINHGISNLEVGPQRQGKGCAASDSRWPFCETSSEPQIKCRPLENSTLPSGPDSENEEDEEVTDGNVGLARASRDTFEVPTCWSPSRFLIG